MNTLGDPETIEALAGQFDRRAADLEAIGARAHQRALATSWSCGRADRFRGEIGQRRVEAARLADEFRGLAHDLRAAAARVRAELDELARIERAIRAAISGFQPEPGCHPPWHGSRWSPANLPVAGDPAWRAVARDLDV